MLNSITYQVCLWIVTFWAEHKLANEYIQEILEFVRVMRAVDNVALILEIKLGLRTQLTAKEFARVCWWPAQCFADLWHICNDSLDSIAFALDLQTKRKTDLISTISISKET